MIAAASMSMAGADAVFRFNAARRIGIGHALGSRAIASTLRSLGWTIFDCVNADEDDNNQDAIWYDLEAFLAEQSTDLKREVALLREYRADDEPYYHVLSLFYDEAHLPLATASKK
jgi:hypothetical protein